MEDVIFSGEDKNISEVSVLLDNQNKEGPAQYKEFDEITIRRKIEKDKGSKYFINDKEVRARDVRLCCRLSTGAPHHHLQAKVNWSTRNLKTY